MKLSYIMIMMATISPITKHPISMGSILIIQTILMCLNMSSNTQNSWYAYILFITMIGGIMIMFMYMSTLASNEKFKFNKLIIIMMLIMLITSTLIEVNDSTLEMFNKMNEIKINTMEQEEMKFTMKFFNLNKANITIMMLSTLFLTMTSVTNIASSFQGPMKKTYV